MKFQDSLLTEGVVGVMRFFKHFTRILTHLAAMVLIITPFTPELAAEEGAVLDLSENEYAITAAAKNEASEASFEKTWGGSFGIALITPGAIRRATYENIKGATDIIAEYGELPIYKVQIRFVFTDESGHAAAQPYIAVVHAGDDLNAVAPIPEIKGFTHAVPPDSTDGFTIDGTNVRINLSSVSQDVNFTICYQPENMSNTTTVGGIAFDVASNATIPTITLVDLPTPLYDVREHDAKTFPNQRFAVLALLFSVYVLLTVIFRVRDKENEDMIESDEDFFNGLHVNK